LLWGLFVNALILGLPHMEMGVRHRPMVVQPSFDAVPRRDIQLILPSQLHQTVNN